MNLPRQSAGVMRSGVRPGFRWSPAGRWPDGFGVKAAKMDKEKCGPLKPGEIGACIFHAPDVGEGNCARCYCGPDRYCLWRACECPQEETPPPPVCRCELVCS
jgi:hypothetical protein